MKVQLFTIRLEENMLEIDQNSLNDFLETVEFKKSDTHFIEEQNCWTVLVHFDDFNFQEDSKTESKTIELSDQDEKIYNNLRIWRSEKADELGWKNFMICHNSQLMNIAVVKPSSIADLKLIKGFGEVKATKFGEDIIALLKTI